MCKKLQLLGTSSPDPLLGLLSSWTTLGGFRSPDPNCFKWQLAMSRSASVYSCVLVTTSAAHQTPGGPAIRGTDSWLDDTD